jgi:hypothetical protein
MPQSAHPSNQTATVIPAPTSGANSIPVAAKQNYARGRVNHIAVEEAQEAPNIVIGMFLVNDTSAVVLLILEHHILSYLLCMLRSITCP